MGVEFTEKGVQISNDGGIDGYGYHIDANDFRTTRVVIQCKRYNVAPVSEPEINQFLGAMNKYQADYGVFITNGRFTNAAKTAAREGSPITLIDGNELVRLVIRYELYIRPVQTYVLEYDEEIIRECNLCAIITENFDICSTNSLGSIGLGISLFSSYPYFSISLQAIL